jgi:hypothetical protein
LSKSFESLPFGGRFLFGEDAIVVGVEAFERARGHEIVFTGLGRRGIAQAYIVIITVMQYGRIFYRPSWSSLWDRARR